MKGFTGLFSELIENYKRKIAYNCWVKDNEKKFHANMRLAEEYRRYYPEQLTKLSKIFGRQAQARLINQWHEREEREGLRGQPNVMLFDQWSQIGPNGENGYDYLKEYTPTRPLENGYDIILPWPWNEHRSCMCFQYIGIEEGKRDWQADSNHSIEFWMPMGIGWVYSGNHSLTVGIIEGIGSIPNYKAIDMSSLYDHVYCDGRFYRRTLDDQIIDRVRDVSIASIFEVGRLINKHLDWRDRQ